MDNGRLHLRDKYAGWHPRRTYHARHLPAIPKTGLNALTGRAVLRRDLVVMVARAQRPWLRGLMWSRANTHQR